MDHSPSLSLAYTRFRDGFGADHQVSAHKDSLRLVFERGTLDAPLAEKLEALGATLTIRMAGQSPAGGLDDLATGMLGDVGFVARRWGDAAAPTLEIRLLAVEEGQSLMASTELNTVALDALLAAKGMPENALTGYLAYRLQRLPPAKAKVLAADLAALLLDYLSS